MNTEDQHRLPKKRSTSVIEGISNLSYFKLILFGLLIYVLIVGLCTTLECMIGIDGNLGGDSSRFDWLDLLYFNFISILTIGYGDLAPHGIYRFITVIEAILGLGIYSLTISIVTVKILVPRKHVIVFSKFAYFCTDENAFLVIYLNTATQYINNLETSWYFKLNEDWKTNSPVKVPFITKSVQTFHLKFDKSIDQIKTLLHRYDCLRIGLSGNLGMAVYSTFMQYELDKILIIKNRSELTRYEGFYKVDEYLGRGDFEMFFHYCPKDAVPLIDFIDR